LTNVKPSIWWIILQGIGIVASILLAFGIQAWWDERQELEEANKLLSSVLEESRQNVAAVSALN
jgi:UDP-N-acetylmuramyl pentapeptide phosphotransferase/UDP-N-acetylglucosamine-1-phosphate transferase